MKHSICLTVVALISSVSLVLGQSKQEQLAIEQEVKKLDLEHADAVLRGDQEAMNKYWTEDFIVTNPFNEIDQADRIKKGIVTYSSFVRESEAIRVHGNTVIVMGKETVVPKGTSPDAGKTINRRYTNIWMMRDGKWRLIARHANVICAK
ncbi:MAG TPA: nuclear transport factor 2 family protein [Chryseolinea sp.]|nr:nuclear transport factor 2 family protein [Chryseolinea sp.]